MKRCTIVVILVLAVCAGPLQAQNIVLNGEFDDSLIGWNATGDPNMLAVWSPADANGSLSSGSVRITNQWPNASNGVTVSQCVPVNTGQRYTYGGKVRVPSGAAQDIDNLAVMSLRFYSGPDCTTSNGGGITSGGSPQSFNVWVAQSASAVARPGARSAEVRALVTKFPAGGTFIAHFDDITLTTLSIFQNGFD